MVKATVLDEMLKIRPMSQAQKDSDEEDKSPRKEVMLKSRSSHSILKKISLPKKEESSLHQAMTERKMDSNRISENVQSLQLSPRNFPTVEDKPNEPKIKHIINSSAIKNGSEEENFESIKQASKDLQYNGYRLEHQ